MQASCRGQPRDAIALLPKIRVAHGRPAHVEKPGGHAKCKAGVAICPDPPPVFFKSTIAIQRQSQHNRQNQKEFAGNMDVA